MLSIAADVFEEPATAQSGRDDRGEALALLILWPALVVAILVLLVHAFIVTNAQAEAEVAASSGLKAAWRSAANEDFRSSYNTVAEVYEDSAYDSQAPHPKTRDMAAAAEDAAARAAATGSGWRWWTPGAVKVQSDWCGGSVEDNANRPQFGDPGWVRVVVSGEVFGPLAALWPNRLDQVYAVATGPAVITAGQAAASPDTQVPVDLPVC